MDSAACFSAGAPMYCLGWTATAAEDIVTSKEQRHSLILLDKTDFRVLAPKSHAPKNFYHNG